MATLVATTRVIAPREQSGKCASDWIAKLALAGARRACQGWQSAM
jgi:hypothetical protein